jgi:hypothetical protein
MEANELTREQAALLHASGFEWSEVFGCWLDTSDHPTTRYDSTDDALDEVCARAEMQT